MGGFILQKIQPLERSMPMQNQKTNSTFIRKIGGAVYHVRINFSKSSKESFNDKLLRLVKNDAAENVKAG